MSFKRAGDDHCALRLQKKQRVAELFMEDIPADEVSQTRCGKYACLVCPQNPVLDTVPMLSIHRQGKKHLTNISIKIEKEHNLNELVQKRKQELYLREASIANKPLNIGKNSIPSNNNVNDMSEPAPLLAKTRQLTESVTRQSRLIGETCVNKSQVQEYRDKNIVLGETNAVKSEGFTDEQPRKMFKKNKPFFQSRVELKLSRDIFKNDVQNLKGLSTLDKATSTAKTDNQMKSGEEKLSKCTIDKGSEGFQKSSTLDNTANNKCDQRTNSDEEKLSKVVKYNHDKMTDNDGKSNNKMNREQQKKYLELKMSGWILDSNGKWIKDENVEFDSDEDEPPLTTE